MQDTSDNVDVIFIKKNDKCVEEIKFCDILLLIWKTMQWLTRTNIKYRDLWSEWCLHIINFCFKGTFVAKCLNIYSTCCTFPLMQDTVTCNFGQECLPSVRFKCSTGNSSKYFTNQKDSAVTCHKDGFASNRWCLPATVLESLSSQTEHTL